MSEVVTFRPKAVESSAPKINHDAIELVERVLAELKSGECDAVGIVTVKDGGAVVGTAYSKSERYHQLLSGASRLQFRLAAED